MAFSGSESNVTDVSAKITVKFTGGDANYPDTRHRVIRVYLDGSKYGGSYESKELGGSTSTFTVTFTNLDPDTLYEWEAQLGYYNTNADQNNHTPTWLDLWCSGDFITLPAVGGSVTPWSWTQSNGEATAAMTKNALAMLGDPDDDCDWIPADNFSHYVWNDLVAKAEETIYAAGAQWYTSDRNGNTYLSARDCRVNKWDTLSAEIYNSVRFNLGSIITTGVNPVSTGDIILGSHFKALTNTINKIIATKT